MSHKIQPHQHNGRFSFDKQSKSESSLLGSLPSLVSSIIKSSRFRGIDTRSTWIQRDLPIERIDSCAITWIGHATFLIQIGGLNILTDPIFGNATPLFRRLLPSGIAPEALPPIDVVLLSHNHPDHMDRASLLFLRDRNPRLSVLVPQGDRNWFLRHAFSDVTEHAWWQISRVKSPVLGELSCTFVPADHWSQRGVFDKNKSLWGGWVICWNGRRIYFAGDTAYTAHFSSIAKEFTPIDIALMPIGPIEPRDHMCHTHIGPEEAIEAFRELGARHFISMHWGTFAFGADAFDAPIHRLVKQWDSLKMHLHDKQLHTAKVGNRLHFG